jgi:hypothetical protein
MRPGGKTWPLFIIKSMRERHSCQLKLFCIWRGYAIIKKFYYEVDDVRMSSRQNENIYLIPPSIKIAVSRKAMLNEAITTGQAASIIGFKTFLTKILQRGQQDERQSKEL